MTGGPLHRLSAPPLSPQWWDDWAATQRSHWIKSGEASDAEYVLDAIQQEFGAPAFRLKRALFASNQLVTDTALILTAAPVIEDAGLFQLAPHLKSVRSAWRMIIAVRDGYPSILCPNDRRPMDDAVYASRCALDGLRVHDLIATTLDLKRVTSRLAGTVAVCGWPQDPLAAVRPVRVYESPLAWILARGAGVFLCGDEQQQQTWLRDCAPGFVAGSIPMGEALLRKMMRQVPKLPPVLVDA